jgi:hypothetical protein
MSDPGGRRPDRWNAVAVVAVCLIVFALALVMFGLL